MRKLPRELAGKPANAMRSASLKMESITAGVVVELVDVMAFPPEPVGLGG